MTWARSSRWWGDNVEWINKPNYVRVISLNDGNRPTVTLWRRQTRGEIFASLCSGMFQNVPECSSMFQNVPECSRMFQNVPECSRMFQNLADNWCVYIPRHIIRSKLLLSTFMLNAACFIQRYIIKNIPFTELRQKNTSLLWRYM